MKAIVYTSELVETNDGSSVLASIIEKAHSNNAKVGVTGGLIFRAGRFLQALEGSDEIVDQLFAKIRVDSRHTNIDVICNEATFSRHFPDWSMKSLEVVDESIFNKATIDNVYKLFKKHMHFRGDLFFDLLRSTLSDAELAGDVNASG